MEDSRKIIDQIKSMTPIVDFLEKHGHKLTKSGLNRWKMLCPFHSEKTPSCIVSEAYNSYHCFGCGASGDIFTYLEEKEGLGFVDAVEYLADECHIEYKPTHDDNDSGTTSRKILREIIDLIYRAYRTQYERLDEDHPAKRNITKRHIETDNAKNFNLFGWSGADDTLVVKALKQKGFTEQQIVDTGCARIDAHGICRMSWRNRLMFVIRDLSGHPVGFTGRVVYDNDTDPRKYVNSSESNVFHKSSIMFCEDIARKRASEDGEVFVVEGQFDVIAMQHINKTNTVASSGTAFTDYHAGLLKRMVGSSGRIVFAFDDDNAGQKAALRTFKTTPSIQYMSYATVTKDKDASDMYRDDPESLRRQMAHTSPLYQHIIDWMAGNSDMTSEAGRTSFVNDCMDAYATIIDPILADNYITYMSLSSGIDASLIRAKSGSGSERRKSDEGRIILDDSSTLQPEDYMLALCYEQPHLVERLREVSMPRDYELVKKAIIDHRKLPDNILGRLRVANENMRTFEQYSPLVDIDELFNSQKAVIELQQRRNTVIDYHRHNIDAINENTSPSNMEQYSSGLQHRLQNK